MRRLLLASVLVLPTAPAAAQCGTWDADFAELGPGGSLRGISPYNRFLGVWDVAEYDAGSGPRLIAAGEFDFCDGASTNRLAAFDGTTWSALGDGVGTPFGGDFQNMAFTAAVFDAGGGPELYVGGYFTSAGGVAASRVARWNGTSWSSVGSGMGGGAPTTVTCLRVASLGGAPALYAAGDFTFAGGASASNIARWNGTSWSPLGAGLGGAYPWTYALAEFDDGTGPALYAGGTFSLAGGNSASYLARWNGTSWSAVGPGLSSSPTDALVDALAVFDDGTGPALYVGGRFTLAGTLPASGIARWNGTAWSSVGALPAYSVVNDLRVLDFGAGPRLVAALQTPLQFQVAEWTGTTWSPIGGAFSTTVQRVTTHDFGAGPKLVAAGFFESVGGVHTGRVARWNGAAWEALGATNGVSGMVEAIARFDDGSGPATYVGGTLRFAGDVATSGVARWNGSAWSAVGNLLGPVEALCVHDDGSGAALYAGTQGAGGSVFRWNGAAWTSLGVASSRVTSLASVASGASRVLVAGGQFTSIAGVPANRVAQWNGASWSALGAGTNGLVRALKTWDAGGGEELYACGDFDTAGGSAASSIARWNGATWSALGSGLGGLVYHEAHALAVHDDGTGNALYVAGLFGSAGGLDAHNVARWNGTAWSTLGLGTPDDASSTIRALASFDETGVGRALYAAGDFLVAGGQPAKHLARWNGSAWSSVAAGVDGSAYALLATEPADGRGPALLIGGTFHVAGALSAHGLASLRSCRITSFCAGDGSLATPCPCSNPGAAGRGCAWSGNADGAVLVAEGGLAPDTLVLRASGMPLAGSSIFLKGDAIDPNGIVFGDGVRCVDGALIRLAIKQNAGGAAAFPEAGNQPVSVRGATPVGSGLTAAYQTYFRAAAPYCTPATFSVTNGLRVVW